MKEYVCNNCGYVVEPVKVVRGNLVTEIILWFFFLIPGLCYSVWRVSGNEMVCPSCNSNQIVPVDSPKGKKMSKNAVLYETPAKPIWKKVWFWVVAWIIIMMIIGIGSSSSASKAVPTTSTQNFNFDLTKKSGAY